MTLVRYTLISIFSLLSASLVAACSMAGCTNNGQETRPTFTITVTHRDRPLSGVNFHITAMGAEQFSGVTEENGTVRIEGLAPGDYWLAGDMLGTGVVYTCFHVASRPSRKAKRKLSYTWGDEAPATAKIAGILFDVHPGKGGTPLWNLIHPVDVPIVGADLKLQDPITHAVYLSSTNPEGKFSFDGTPFGTYVLHIESGAAGNRAYDVTDQLITFDASATRNWLVFKRRDPSGGSCGGAELELQLQ